MSFAYFQDEMNDVSPHTDGFIFSVNENLEPAWITYFGGTSSLPTNVVGSDYSNGIAISQNGNFMVVVGETQSETNFPLQDAGNGAYWQPLLMGGTEGFISVFDIGVGLTVEDIGDSIEGLFSVYPNPTNGQVSLMIHPDIAHQSYLIEVYSSTGQRIQTMSANEISSNGVIQLDFSGKLASGPYVVRLISSYGSYSKTIIYHGN